MRLGCSLQLKASPLFTPMGSATGRRWVKYLLCSVLLASTAAPADERVIFSDYQGSLRVKEVDGTRHVVRFSGEVEVSGTLVFSLDRLSETEFGDPLFARFIPDSDQLDRFPQVVEGFYPAPLERISLINIGELYAQLFGADTRATSAELRKAGTIKLAAYATSVECDSRQYYAQVESFEPVESLAAINTTPLLGC